MSGKWENTDPRLPSDPRTHEPRDQRDKGAAPLKPRDAGTLIILDRSGAKVSVLVGRRGKKHAFMADRFVFPGGRTDPVDSRIPLVTERGLRGDDLEKLLALTSKRVTPRRVAACALSAVRETWEEAGILIGRRTDKPTALPGAWAGFGAEGVEPDLSKLRFVARAITPPGRVRRFDARFFACWRDEAVAKVLPDGGPTNELSDLTWITLDDAIESDKLPGITRIIVKHIAERLKIDADLDGVVDVPMHREKRGDFIQEVL